MSITRHAAAASASRREQIERLAADANGAAATPIPTPMVGVKKRVELVKLNRMKVDRDNYQRDLEPHRLAALRRDWNPEGAGVLALSQRADGSVWLLDGQHRREIMLEQGVTETLCYIYIGLSIEQEADIFDLLNDRLRVHPLTRFNARLRAGKATEVAISNLLGLYGTKVAWVTTQGYPCTAELKRLYLNGALRDTIEILEGCWPYDDVRRTPLVVRAMGQVCIYYLEGDGVPKKKMENLIKKFSAVELDRLVRLARAKAPGTGKPIWYWLTSAFQSTHGGHR